MARSNKSLVSDARQAIEVCPGINARLAARRITRAMERHLQGAGLSMPQFALMVHIAAAQDDTIRALAVRSGLDQSTLSRTLRGLERAGLIEIAVVEKDLRRRVVWLTERGARRLEAAMPAWRSACAAVAAHVESGNFRALAEAAAVLDTQTPGPQV